MSKRDILLLLQELLCNAILTKTDPEDYSGLSTRYYVDQEQLMKNIETELAKIGGDDGHFCEHTRTYKQYAKMDCRWCGR